MSEPRYLNRELSLLAFHRRVLAMAEDESLPLLERLRFLCISSSNLDEFFEVRVAAVKQKIALRVRETGVDKADPVALLQALRQRVRAMIDDQYRLLNADLIPALAGEGIYFLRRDHWNARQRAWLADYMRQWVLPVVTPLSIDPAHPFPRIANKNLHFIVSLHGKDAFGRSHRYALIPIPRTLPRLVKLPDEVAGEGVAFVFLSSVIHAFVGDLFPGLTVEGCYQFRVTRDTELYIDEEEMEDLKRELQGRLEQQRRFGRAVRLEVSDNCPEAVAEYLCRQLQVEAEDLYRVNGPVNLHRLESVYDDVSRPDLKFPDFTPVLPARLEDAEDYFAVLRRGEVLLHHPYDAFTPVVDLVRQAAADPDVLAIRQTLYRTASRSAIADALVQAARNGKEVTAVIELRARFDEADNIRLAERLYQAGVHVVYGVVGYKTHAKMLLIVRREGKGVRRYVHLGTGNYHEITARFYTDIGLLSADPVLAEDVQRVFLQLTGLGHAVALNKLVQAPFGLHCFLLDRIQRETELARQGRKGRIIARMNGLEDPEIIDALYAASQAGVRIDLIVRGICCLRPGVEGLSENIRVRSVLGRFLEHSRVFYFGNDGDPVVYGSSADWLIRNLHRRVEVAFPIQPRPLKRQAIREALRYYLRDTAGAWELRSDGEYRRVRRRGRPFSAQAQLLADRQPQ
ncbi:polyphosphate kinase [Methylomarinovum caldicuralii]|uniref:Polyphosphate kinase n=1 Tax=Methylomarinovum caldicuralii TaxID=438856 RepID=A0AAU9BRW6_9GAMM|nr:polyphosphate kinase 1 [Methylomarinovum caldicuralii]BCX81251.1 polyphosphate kinase [Methylomarinovum caldicuralii]